MTPVKYECGAKDLINIYTFKTDSNGEITERSFNNHP